MRKYPVILILLFCLATAVCEAQTSGKKQNSGGDGDTVNRHDIGINSIGLLRALFNAEDNDNVSPYLFAYNYDMGKTVLRVGFGPEYSSSTTTHEGFSDSEKRTDLKLDGRIGIGFDVVETNRWTVRTGLDVIGGYAVDRTTDDTGFDAVTMESEDWHLGGGPFVQVFFRINDRISLSTDAALYMTHFNTRNTELFENFPDFDNVLSETTGQRLDIFLPTSLFIHFHF